jgi:hypothetical protein
MPLAPAPPPHVLQLLDWLAERPRTYAQTMEAWRTHCPRLSAWEDSLAGGFVRRDSSLVSLTDAGRAARLLAESRSAGVLADPSFVFS